VSVNQTKEKNIHEHHRQRMRDRFLKQGLVGFSHHQALEMLLFYCYPRQDTNAIAHRMINAYGTLHNLLEASPKDIMHRCHCSERVATLVSFVPQFAQMYLRSKWDTTAPILEDVTQASQYALSLFVGHTRETFYVLCLNAKRKLNHCALISQGTIEETAVYMREIVDQSITHKATAVILAHNHPGGTPAPSAQDKMSTAKIKDALRPISIKVLDHIIVAGNQYYSFASNGVLVEGYG